MLNKLSMYSSAILLWLILLAIGSNFNTGSSFAPACILISFLIGFCFQSFALLQIFISLLLPLSIFLPFGLVFSVSLTGIFGRSGNKPVDYVLSAFLGLISSLIVSFTLPFLYPSETDNADEEEQEQNSRKRIISSSFGVPTLILLLLVALIGALLYYSYNRSPYSVLQPKRLSMRHVLIFNDSKVIDAYINLKSADVIPPDHVFRNNWAGHGFTYTKKVRSHQISNVESKNLDDFVFYKNVLAEVGPSLNPDLYNPNITVKSTLLPNQNTRYDISIATSKYLSNQHVLVKTNNSSIITDWSFSGVKPYYDTIENAYVWDLVPGYTRFNAENENEKAPKIQGFSMDVKPTRERIEIHVRSHFLEKAVWTDRKSVV